MPFDDKRSTNNGNPGAFCDEETPTDRSSRKAANDVDKPWASRNASAM